MLSRNSQRVQGFRIIQVRLRELEELIGQWLDLLVAEGAEGGRVATGVALGPADLLEQALDELFHPAVIPQAAAKLFERLPCLPALASDFADHALGHGCPVAAKALQVDVAIADVTGGAAKLAEQLFHPPGLR